MFQKAILALGLVLSVIVGIFLTSTPSATVVAQGEITPAPTYTFYPTYTPLPTYTPYPTFTPQPTFTPTPTLSLPPDLTFPTVQALSDEAQIGSSYTHSSGQFSMNDIPSWNRTQRGRFGDARVTLSNPWMYSFVEVAVLAWSGGDDVASVRAWLTEERLNDLWGVYEAWVPTRYDEGENQVVADVRLQFRGLPFLGRMVVQPAGDTVMMVTIVVPDNSRQLLTTLQKLIVPSITIYAFPGKTIPPTLGD